MTKKTAEKVLSYEDRMKWFTQARFGMFIHWGVYAVPARGEWVRSAEKIADENYRPYFEEFNPFRYDPRTWAGIAKAAGQQYVVMTAKHHDGFCLFDSKLTDWKATKTPAKRDLVREYVEAFRAEGLKVGFYYSLLDWNHPHYPVDQYHPLRENAAAKAQKRDFSKYLDYLHGQVKELMTNYGKLDILWFDFSYGELSGDAWRAKELVKMVRSHWPNVILDNRLMAGHLEGGLGEIGDFASPEQCIPAEGMTDKAGKPIVWEACITLNDHWGYGRDDKNFKSPAQVVRMLVECVSKGGNLLLNVGPTAYGEIQPECVEILHRVGHWMHLNGASIYGAGRAGLPKPEWGYYTRSVSDPKRLFAHVMHRPVGPIPLLGIASQAKKARLVADGSEVSMARPWNVMEGSKDAYLHLPHELPDELDTVVEVTME